MSGYTLVFGVLDDKDVDEMLPAVSSSAQKVVLTRPGSTRGRPPGDISALSRCSNTVVVESPREALDHALATEAPVLVCGSIYLVGEARGQLRERFGVPPRY